MHDRPIVEKIDPSLAAELRRPLPTYRAVFNRGMTAIALLLTALAILPLGSILLEILLRGGQNFSWAVFTNIPAPVGVTDVPNGFGNAILGTLMMVGIASAIAIPVGVLTGIFLSEFGRNTVIGSSIRFIITILTGIPSIIAGVFAYGVLILNKVTQFSAVAGGFALAVIMLPIVALTTEEALKLIPNHQRLGSAALGANRLQTTFRVVVAAAIPAITTGVLLAVARAAGETAPLLFTALFSISWPDGLFNPTPSLSVLIYNYANSPDLGQNQMAWTAALVLVGLVLCISIISRLATRRRQ
ncbi:phosphate ABC transporter permease PtsA [Chroococcidiopsis sp. CCALA 051]|uniref:phosphate ABC transporter permease PstA n=1 Tax=Chroococcidiopsis sp. CCALA 051 TaxID=869949 RepID=UPI000D0CC154|nr:phosphate ABC transporter permease PstA [Chroococcidiopsis sp. CCALA 051]PSM46765.1 phosphate ABC transporter permease PtsA [Chroococcidiopsis sp. CCALA 051]